MMLLALLITWAIFAPPLLAFLAYKHAVRVFGFGMRTIAEQVLQGDESNAEKFADDYVREVGAQKGLEILRDTRAGIIAVEYHLENRLMRDSIPPQFGGR